MTKVPLTIMALIVLTALCDTVSQIFFKNAINDTGTDIRGLKDVPGFIWRLAVTPKVWLGMLFPCLSLGMWLFVLSKADLNFAFSLDSVHYIFVALAARFILKERVGRTRWLGTILIAAGVFLVALTNG